jgi:hypothetical protein
MDQFFGYCDTMEGYYDLFEQAAQSGMLPPVVIPR